MAKNATLEHSSNKEIRMKQEEIREKPRLSFYWMTAMMNRKWNGTT
jgi:hypothetical protein